MRLELPASLRAARAARTAVTEALADWGTHDATGASAVADPASSAVPDDGFGALDAVILLTDELVTNAVVHARSALRLELNATPTLVRVSVSDDSTVIPTPRREFELIPDLGEGWERSDSAARRDRQLDDMAEGGRGLRLVELLASRWGVEPLPHGKRVWFEIDVP